MSPARFQLTVELVNRCNLRCAYCVRDEAALHRDAFAALDLALLDRVLRQAGSLVSPLGVGFTGGEPTLHPGFAEAVRIAAERSGRVSLVSNGTLFDRAQAALREHRAAIAQVAFSLDGASAAAHDRWRGPGSYERLMAAVAWCREAGIPFAFKVVVRRDSLPALGHFVGLARRLGAERVTFSHLLPTSEALEAACGLTDAERARAELTVLALGEASGMAVAIGPNRENRDPAPPCLPLAGLQANLDYRGRLTLCCNLAGYRGTETEHDVVADLGREDFAAAWPRLQARAARQVAARRSALAAGRRGSPCVLCVKTLKAPAEAPRALVQASP